MSENITLPLSQVIENKKKKLRALRATSKSTTTTTSKTLTIRNKGGRIGGGGIKKNITTNTFKASASSLDSGGIKSKAASLKITIENKKALKKQQVAQPPKENITAESLRITTVNEKYKPNSVPLSSIKKTVMSPKMSILKRGGGGGSRFTSASTSSIPLSFKKTIQNDRSNDNHYSNSMMSNGYNNNNHYSNNSGGGGGGGYMNNSQDQYQPQSTILSSRNPNHVWQSSSHGGSGSDGYHSSTSRYNNNNHNNHHHHHHHGGGGSGGGSGNGNPPQLYSGSRLRIANINFGVTEEDLERIFRRFGEIKSVSINYDNAGRSNGTASIVFAYRRDAEEAIRNFDGAKLDGRPMAVMF